MILRPGMSGDYVTTVEDFLKDLKLYTGPIDSIFGGGLESAVKNYQKGEGLSPSGLVDRLTWTHMFPGKAAPVSTLAGAPLLNRCLALTGTFETSTYPPESFAGLTGNFDQMGISFGVCQWNIGQGTLQPLLQQMFEQHTGTAQSIFHEHFDTVRALGASPIADQLAFARSIQVKNQVMEPWKGMLLTLGRTHEFQGVQAHHATRLYDHAIQLCRDYGLISERALALMFDIATQNGSISSITRAAILADFTQLHSDQDNEVAKMRIIANRCAEAAQKQYVDDVRTRKLTIANGTGVVHGLVYDLADAYCITLNRFEMSEAAVS
jgi:peptidoglycan hydrolase-like protein with peptidoglycan-binding domain